MLNIDKFSIKGCVAMLAAVAAVGLAACDDDDDDYTIPDVPACQVISVSFGSDSIKAGNAYDFQLKKSGDQTLYIWFDRNVFYDTRDASQITTTGGLSVSEAIVPGSKSYIQVSVNIPTINSSYSLTFPLGTVSNGQLEYSTGNVVVNFKGTNKKITIPEAPVAATSTEAIKLYNFLKDNYQTKTLSGMMAKVNWNYTNSTAIGETYGKTPLLNGFDYIHMPYSENGANWINYRDITPAKEWADKGGIVQINWHWLFPTAAADGDFADSYKAAVKGSNLSYEPSTVLDIDKVFTADTYENYVYELGMTTVIDYLTLLKDAKIPVLWRPYHEASGAWFWWGQKGATTFKKLWVDMFDRFAKAGLDNIIWVWTSQVDDIETWYPGDKYVDIVGTDTYGKDVTTHTAYFTTLSTGISKIITLSETGIGTVAHSVADGKCAAMASITEQLDAGCGWSWFMPWYDSDDVAADKKHYAEEEWKAAVADSRILWLGDYK